VFNLDRFKQAQETAWGFTTALAEMRAGEKRSHWIWYIFPQLSGLGSSSEARTFGLDGLEEAVAYLQDATLRARLLAITEVVASKVRSVALKTLMGSSIDALKLVSSMTLFEHAAQQLHDAEALPEYESIARHAKEILLAAKSQGYPACKYTLTKLRNSPSKT
jgi:uncharacterized protein (DUF1810 family)